jgi:hypothetical protein
MSIAALDTALSAEGLTRLGGFHPDPADDLPGTGTLVLVGPAQDFWRHFGAAPERVDGAPDPLDRWSARVLGAIARAQGARALFPFGGPPWRPFVTWARRSGWAHVSPVGLLVHPEAGLWLSFRGALAFATRLDLPPPPPNPCDSCTARPCLSACPVGALGPAGYDTAACHGFLDSPPGGTCMAGGCQVRAACPVSRGWHRDPAQSAFHMEAFHPCPAPSS